MKEFIHILKFIITATAVICVLSSCDDNLKAIQKMQLTYNEPIGEVEQMLLKHTDSGYIKMKLAGDKMLDFSNDSYPYTEFPDGIDVTIYEKKRDTSIRTTITANYGILYDDSKLVDLRGNVIITNADGNTFMGEQLYWDQTKQWIFTDEDFVITFDGATNAGNKLDAKENLSVIQVRNSRTQFYRKPKL